MRTGSCFKGLPLEKNRKVVKRFFFFARNKIDMSEMHMRTFSLQAFHSLNMSFICVVVGKF